MQIQHGAYIVLRYTGFKIDLVSTQIHCRSAVYYILNQHQICKLSEDHKCRPLPLIIAHYYDIISIAVKLLISLVSSLTLSFFFKFIPSNVAVIFIDKSINKSYKEKHKIINLNKIYLRMKPVRNLKRSFQNIL